MAGLTLEKSVGTVEAARLLGIESALFRFLEMQCADFLSSSRLEFPGGYCSGDLKILAEAARLHGLGLAPDALRSHLAAMLADPSAWSENSPRNGASASPFAPRLIAVASGKGGVGKSSIALSLGAQLVRSGLRVALLDADLGTANTHLLAGLKVGKTLKDVLAGLCALEDAIAPVPGGPDIIPGSSGIYEMANLSAPRRRDLLEKIRKLEARYDTILVDAAAGVSGSVLDFVSAADFTIVVTTPEATAITDAYALIKLAAERNPRIRVGVVMNRARSAAEGEGAMERISTCAQRFLDISIIRLGCVWEDSRVRRAVNERSPFLLSYPDSRASASIRKLAAALVREKIVPARARG
jgi:flagellar biosynthesis protein FlhG